MFTQKLLLNRFEYIREDVESICSGLKDDVQRLTLRWVQEPCRLVVQLLCETQLGDSVVTRNPMLHAMNRSLASVV